MSRRQRYLCKKLEEGEIDFVDPIEAQRKLTLLNQAPTIFINAIKAGWISYPTTKQTASLDDPEKFVGKYDCIRAYQLRQTGLTYRQVAKMIGCGIGRLFAVINHGESMLLAEKINNLKQQKSAIVTPKPKAKQSNKTIKSTTKQTK